MDRTVEVATGESVAFTYELAGLGSRFFAVFVDLTIQLAVALAGLLALGVVVSAGGPAAHVATPGRFARAVALGLAIAAGFVLFFGYFIVLEWLWQGRTPGKRLLGIRVVRDGGFPVDITSSVVRNAIRILEVAAGFYAVSALAALLSPQNRRLGDLAAGTIVVRDARFERERAFARDLVDRPAAGKASAGGDPLVRELRGAHRDLVLRYAARRDALTPSARAAVAAEIALDVRPRLPATFAHLDDDALLLYVAGVLAQR